MPQTASITASQNGLHTLHMQGQFTHPHWVAFLFSSLAQKNISVVSGRALQDAKHDWDACFELCFDASSALPSSLDYIDLAHRGALNGDAQAPRLSSFNIVPRPSGIEVRLNGPDQIGFLGHMLRRISLLALFPADIEIKTVTGTIEDRIVFRTIGGGAVSESVAGLLQNMLQEMVS